jgi:hypothetical protein
MLAVGEWWYHTDFKTNPNKFTQLIIQITTTGKEEQRVNDIISEIRAMPLTLPYSIWVVREPKWPSFYPEADYVIVVDPSFVAKSRYKARAMEYSRLQRAELGLNRSDVKLLFLDDDTSPTQAYIETAFAADYDVCQGVTSPRVRYGSLPIKHFLLSHVDDLRLLSCVIYCSFFQGVIRRPLYVHGEGLCITGQAEEIVTWNYPIFASEDLVFGQNAADKGLRWGWFHEYIQLTSPWTWGEFLEQRRRWLWGNIVAIRSREVMPLWAALLVGGKYFLGFFTFGASLISICLILTHVIHVSPIADIVFLSSLSAWLAAFGLSGWVNSARWDPSQHITAKFTFHRCFQTLVAIILCPLTTACTMVTLTVAFLMGNPKKFITIGKTKETAAKRKKGKARDTLARLVLRPLYGNKPDEPELERT